MDFWTVHSDGSCQKNPSNRASYGFTIHHYVELVKEGNGGLYGDYLDNNIAEFYGLYKGLEALQNYIHKPCLIEVKSDSKLIIQILKKKWKLRKDRPFYEIAKKCESLVSLLRKKGGDFGFTWIPRQKNQACDYLSKHDLPPTSFDFNKIQRKGIDK